MINRRDLLTFGGGAAAGLVVTPAPWKLLDDSAIWTQNWPWTPRLPRGEVKERFTHCTLCPAACAMRARCVGGRPVSVAGVEGDEASGGRLCAAGVGAHHLAYHRRRVRQVLHYGRPSKAESLYRTVAERAAGAGITIVDGNPRRAVSGWYGKLAAALKGSRHVTAGLEPVVDLERTRTILSFGVPVLDDWGAPGRVWKRREQLYVIQAEASQSRTALLADRWLRIRPGSEEALALAVAGRVTLRWAAERTGLSEEQIRDAARAFREGQPAVALGEAGEFLNGLVGSAGRPGGLYGAGPGMERLRDVPDGSLQVVLLDAPVDYAELEPKLGPGPVVVSLNPLADERIPWQAPLPVFGESEEDTPGNEPRFSFALAAAMMKAPGGVMTADEFLAGLAKALGAPEPPALEELRKRKAEALRAAGRGALVTPDGSRFQAGTAEEMWEALRNGARWVEDEPESGYQAPAAPEAREAAREGLVLIAARWKGARAESPLVTKIYQESSLRPPGDVVRMHPETGRGLGLRDGERAEVKTARGRAGARVRFDARVLPGTVEAEAGPGGRVAALAAGATPVTLRRA